MSRYIRLWLPVIIWAGALFYFSSIPNLRASTNNFYDEVIRSTAHFFFYALGYWLIYRALQKKLTWWPLVFTCLYAVSDEIHQLFIPTRSFQIKDLMVDFSGALLGKALTRK